MDVGHGQLVGRRLKNVAFVVGLRELTPIGRRATGEGDGGGFERFAEVYQDRPYGPRCPDESETEDPVGEVLPKFPFDVRRSLSQPSRCSAMTLESNAVSGRRRSTAVSTRATSRREKHAAHAGACTTGSKCSHACLGLHFAARDSSLHLYGGRVGFRPSRAAAAASSRFAKS